MFPLKQVSMDVFAIVGMLLVMLAIGPLALGTTGALCCASRGCIVGWRDAILAALARYFRAVKGVVVAEMLSLWTFATRTVPATLARVLSVVGACMRAGLKKAYGFVSRQAWIVPVVFFLLASGSLVEVVASLRL